MPRERSADCMARPSAISDTTRVLETAAVQAQERLARSLVDDALQAVRALPAEVTLLLLLTGEHYDPLPGCPTDSTDQPSHLVTNAVFGRSLIGPLLVHKLAPRGRCRSCYLERPWRVPVFGALGQTEAWCTACLHKHFSHAWLRLLRQEEALRFLEHTHTLQYVAMPVYVPLSAAPETPPPPYPSEAEAPVHPD